MVFILITCFTDISCTLARIWVCSRNKLIRIRILAADSLSIADKLLILIIIYILLHPWLVSSYGVAGIAD